MEKVTHLYDFVKLRVNKMFEIYCVKIIANFFFFVKINLHK